MTAPNVEVEALRPDWPAILHRIQEGDQAAVDEMYRQFRTFLNFFRHQIGYEDAGDLFHDLIFDLIAQIKQGIIREPERIVGYASVIARRKVAQWIEHRMKARRHKDVTEAHGIAC